MELRRVVRGEKKDAPKLMLAEVIKAVKGKASKEDPVQIYVRARMCPYHPGALESEHEEYYVNQEGILFRGCDLVTRNSRPGHNPYRWWVESVRYELTASGSVLLPERGPMRNTRERRTVKIYRNLESIAAEFMRCSEPFPHPNTKITISAS